MAQIEVAATVHNWDGCLLHFIAKKASATGGKLREPSCRTCPIDSEVRRKKNGIMKVIDISSRPFGTAALQLALAASI